MVLGIISKSESKWNPMFIMHKTFPHHFFISNNDTPDCPEVESYSKLFIRIVYGSGMSLGSQYLLDMEYGAGSKQRHPCLKNWSLPVHLFFYIHSDVSIPFTCSSNIPVYIQVGLTGIESGQEEDYMSLDLVAEIASLDDEIEFEVLSHGVM